MAFNRFILHIGCFDMLCICYRDSQASTGDEREPSMLSNEYIELSPVLTSHNSNSNSFNYSASQLPVAGPLSSSSTASSSHLYMNTAGVSNSGHSASFDSNYSNYAIPASSNQGPPPPSMMRQHSAGPFVEKYEKRVSVSSMSSSTGGIHSDKEDQGHDILSVMVSHDFLIPCLFALFVLLRNILKCKLIK